MMPSPSLLPLPRQLDPEYFLQSLVEQSPVPPGAFQAYADATMLQVRAMDDQDAFAQLFSDELALPH